MLLHFSKSDYMILFPPIADMYLCWGNILFEEKSSLTVNNWLKIRLFLAVYGENIHNDCIPWCSAQHKRYHLVCLRQVLFKLALKSSAFLFSDSFSKHNCNMNEQYEEPQDSLVIWILKWNFLSGLQGSISSHRFLSRLTIIESFSS